MKDPKVEAILAKIAKAQGRDEADLYAPLPFGVLTADDYAVLAKAGLLREDAP